MLTNSRLAILVLFAVITPMAGCDSAEKAPDTDVAAAPVPAPPLTPFQQEIVSAKAEVTLPGAWKSNYRLVDKADTTNGAFRAFEFHYAADSASKVPSRLLLVIRAFKKARWAKISASQEAVAIKLADHGDVVYAFSIVTSNPYPASTPASLRVEQMMIELTANGSPFKMTFK
jgi:hypothetical protein